MHYVAHDLPRDIINEGASGLADVIHSVGGGVSTVVNAAGDVAAGGLGDALHQIGKAGGAVASSFSSGDAAPAPDAGMPPGYDGYDGGTPGYDGGGVDGAAGPYDDGTDPFEGVNEGWDDGEGWDDVDDDQTAGDM